MKTLQELAAIPLAVLVCNHPALKREIFCVQNSAYSEYKTKENHYAYVTETLVSRKREWITIVEKNSEEILKRVLEVPKMFQQHIVSLTVSIALRMLSWLTHHEGAFGLAVTREYAVEFFETSLFAQNGLVDVERVAMKLIRDLSLPFELRYAVACFYFIEQGSGGQSKFYSEMLSRDQNNRRLISELIHKGTNSAAFDWCFCYHTNDNVIDPEMSNIEGFHKAITFRNVTAARYFLDRVEPGFKPVLVWDCAMKLVPFRYSFSQLLVIFQDQRSAIATGPMSAENGFVIPINYYSDTMYFLFCNMTDSDKVQFLSIDMDIHSRSHNAFHYLLQWPYQDRVLDMVSALWDRMTVTCYINLLFGVQAKIDTLSEHCQYKRYCKESQHYDYRSILKRLWRNTPDKFKRAIFLHDNPEPDDGVVNAGHIFVFRLFEMQNLTVADEETIGLILRDLMPEEKRNVLHSVYGSDICLNLVENGHLKLADTFISECGLDSTDAMSEFKKALIMSKYGRSTIRYLMCKNNNLEIADRFFKWCSAGTGGSDTGSGTNGCKRDTDLNYLMNVINEESIGLNCNPTQLLRHHCAMGRMSE